MCVIVYEASIITSSNTRYFEGVQYVRFIVQSLSGQSHINCDSVDLSPGNRSNMVSRHRTACVCGGGAVLKMKEP